MRPCDDTFGLVRGNRRKAVFAFKGLFTEGICPYSLLGSGLLSRISEVRGKSKLAAHTPIFANKIAGRKVLNLGSGRQVSGFHRASECMLNMASTCLALKAIIGCQLATRRI